ncbi:MAG: GNAT family N-acetyltransferase [Propionibacteriaceae bacterium]|nr:GNAT family N-acetyltransferase [Propionibacteriaceae bacterium]
MLPDDHDDHPDETAASLAFAIATTSDVQAIVALVNRAYSHHPGAKGWVGDRAFQDAERADEAEVTELITTPDSLMLLGRHGSRLVSCCSLSHVGQTAHLGLFAVDPDLQSQGLGRATLTAAEQFAATTWLAERMDIEVMAHHEPVLRWYERTGYILTGEQSYYVERSGRRAATLLGMSKTLVKGAVGGRLFQR